MSLATSSPTPSRRARSSSRGLERLEQLYGDPDRLFRYRWPDGEWRDWPPPYAGPAIIGKPIGDPPAPIGPNWVGQACA